jgi:tRNA1Val (adenine37-N6)-methyltransferase
MKYDEILGCKFIQSDNTQKITYDSVFIPYFVGRIKKHARVIELGSGNGVASILLKNFNKSIEFYLEGIEVQKDLYNISLENAKLNSMDISFYNLDIRSISSKYYGKYDIVFSNPPYMKNNSGKISPYKQRDIARREVNGSIEDFVKAAALLLKNRSKFYTIWRSERLQELMVLLDRYNLKVKTLRPIYPSISKNSYAFLLMSVKNANYGLDLLPPLYIRNENDEINDEIKEIYSIF